MGIRFSAPSSNLRETNQRGAPVATMLTPQPVRVVSETGEGRRYPHCRWPGWFYGELATRHRRESRGPPMR